MILQQHFISKLTACISRCSSDNPNHGSLDSDCANLEDTEKARIDGRKTVFAI